MIPGTINAYKNLYLRIVLYNLVNTLVAALLPAFRSTWKYSKFAPSLTQSAVTPTG